MSERRGRGEVATAPAGEPPLDLALRVDDELARAIAEGLGSGWQVTADTASAVAVVVDAGAPELPDLLDRAAAGLVLVVVVVHGRFGAASGGTDTDGADPQDVARWLSEAHVDVAQPDAAEVLARLSRLRHARAMGHALTAVTAGRDAFAEELQRFGYSVSHDLKEPLRAITGFSRLLQTRHADALDGQMSTYLAFVTDGAARLEAMLNALLQRSRLMRHESAPDDVHLASVVSAALRQCDTSSAEVVVGGLPIVRVDPDLVALVVSALVDNAMKFSANEPAPRVAIGGGADADGWWLSVTDNGVGLRPGDEDRVYDMFSRLQTREVYGGIGAGLSIAAQATSLIGGELSYDTGDGQTTFTLRVPTAGLVSEE